jgi:prepilin-type N-terminal cleavage/methylation domain-containing protein
MPAFGRRFLADERGFTLPEVMVTVGIMVVVLFSLYNIFDATIRVFSFGNDKVEATDNARVGLEKVERELRAAYPYDKSDALDTNDHLFFTTTTPATGAKPATNNQVTFGNDLNGDRRLTCDPLAVTGCEYITYKLTSAANPANACTASPCSLRRVNGANSASAGDSVVDNVAVNGLTFTYLKSDGTALTSADGESAIGLVRVRVNVEVDGRTQALTTYVKLRNRL